MYKRRKNKKEIKKNKKNIKMICILNGKLGNDENQKNLTKTPLINFYISLFFCLFYFQYNFLHLSTLLSSLDSNKRVFLFFFLIILKQFSNSFFFCFSFFFLNLMNLLTHTESIIQALNPKFFVKNNKE